MEAAIRSTGLCRRFGKINAIKNLDLTVHSERITAFLGPNGAGKTTTIRLLLGLVKPNAGTCEVLGYPPGHPEALSQIGALVETPSLYDHLTGLENLEITRLMRNEPRPEVDCVLQMVGLSQDARRPVRDYSLGMRQRLGMALALMGKPKLLILDEPTNGLDPVGIQEIRELIRRLPAETGATVFLSSHILAEVEQIAEDIIVIHRGCLRYQGPMTSFGLGSAAPFQVFVRVNDNEGAIKHLTEKGVKVKYEQNKLFIYAQEFEIPSIVSNLVNAKIDLYELSPCKVNLESRFLAMLEEE